MSTKEQVHGVRNGMGNVMHDASALLAATADASHEEMIDARKELADTLETAQDACALMNTETIKGTKSADKLGRTIPYEATGVAFGIGALIGFLLGRHR